MKTIYTPEEIAKMLRTSRSTIYRWLRSGDIKSIQIGKMYRVTRDDLEEFIGRPLPREE